VVWLEGMAVDMSTSIILLLQRLQEIRESLGDKSLASIYHMLNESEEIALRIQQESPEHARRESRHLAPKLFTR
jgi:hypothetical protein